jgi:hypothetical protein
VDLVAPAENVQWDEKWNMTLEALVVGNPRPADRSMAYRTHKVPAPLSVRRPQKFHAPPTKLRLPGADDDSSGATNTIFDFRSTTVYSGALWLFTLWKRLPNTISDNFTSATECDGSLNIVRSPKTDRVTDKAVRRNTSGNARSSVN